MPLPWRRLSTTLVLLAGLCAASRPLAAEEWHEAYRSGVQSLARGEARSAVESLRRAIALRPEPGRNVVTYGTNIEARYFPYLRLAEAYLALGQLDSAREALDVSAAHKGEPVEDRKALLARVESAAEARRPPPTTLAAALAPAPVVAATAPPPTEPALPPPTTLAVAVPTPEPAAPARRETAAPRRSEAPPSPPVLATPEPTAAAPAPGTLEIVSEPRGAPASVDDAPLGGGWIAFGAVALALVAAVAWTVLRRPADAASVWKATPLPSLGLPSGPRTPSGNLNPGARLDPAGQEWFGEFRLLELLGRGGMASVYKAERNTELQALKRPLSSFLDDPDFIARFLREADIGRTLNHPNIVRILGRGHVGDVPYFTMEMLEGDTLQAFVSGHGPTAPRQAAFLVAQIAEALDFAHSKGVIHRDLKPSNIMLLPDGTAKVMDFGIAQAVRFEGLTATGAFLGTPDYVAPEIIEGRGAGPRSDLYSLGALFYELLTGQRPFTGDSAFAILRKHCSEDVRPPSEVNPEIPGELEAVVLRLLAKAPDARVPSAEELVVSLRDWLNRAA